MMPRTAIPLVVALAIASLSLGCQSHEAKVTDLQKQYEQLGGQFRKDCSAEMLSLPQRLSPKCSAEDKKVTEAWSQLQAERAKK